MAVRKRTNVINESESDRDCAGSTEDGRDERDGSSSDDDDPDAEGCSDVQSHAGLASDEVDYDGGPLPLSYTNWTRFEGVFKAYQSSTQQPFRLRTSASVADRNRDRKAKYDKSTAAKKKAPVLWDEKQGSYFRKYICTHGWEPKKKKAAENGGTKRKRTNHVIRGIGCEAFVRVGLKKTGSKYSVQVTGISTEHNHPVGTEYMFTYAENRKVTSPSKQEDLERMYLGGSKKKLILKTLRESTGIPFLPKDIENMTAAVRERRSRGMTENERVDLLLETFCETPGNVVESFTDDSGLTSCITLQTAHMRRMVARFPEVLCVDATYGTNINRYRLFSFMVTDSFGEGAFAQHAFLDGESLDNMKAAITAFKKNNPVWIEVNVLVIDKDFNELALLKEEFPAATVILCHFHVIDYLHREVSKAKYRFDSFQKVHVKSFISFMVKSATEKEFMHFLTAMEKLCGPTHQFMVYFSGNWLNCKDLWCRYLRGHIPHLDNNTNNRLEASWGAVKDTLSSTLPMDECINNVWAHQTTKESSYQLRTLKIGIRQNHRYDEEMSMLAKVVTMFACDWVEPQYQLSLRATYAFSGDEGGDGGIGIYRVKSAASGHVYAVDPVHAVCSCNVYTSLLLPCRHIMYLRRVVQVRGSIIPCDQIKKRWLIADSGEYDRQAQSLPGRHHITQTRPTSALTCNQKYKKIFAVCQRLAERVAEKGTCSFNTWFDRLSGLEKAARADLSDGVGAGDSGGIVGDTDDKIGDDIGDDIGGIGDGIGDLGDEIGDGGGAGADDGDDEITQLSQTTVDNLTTLVAEYAADRSDSPVEESKKYAKPKTKLNEASRPGGRPRTTKAAAKAKKARIFADSKRLATRLHAEGDITLKHLQECITPGRLSLHECGAIIDSLVQVFSNPVKKDLGVAAKASMELVAKRPRCVLLADGCEITEPTHIRYVFPVVLVDRCLEYARHFTEKLRLPEDDVAVEICDVGCFQVTTLHAMRQYHRLFELVSSTRLLLDWIEQFRFTEEDAVKERARQNILAVIPTLNLTQALLTGCSSINFDSLSSFAASAWLSDACVFTTIRNISRGAKRHVRVVDPLFIQFDEQVDLQRKMLTGYDEFVSDISHDGIVCCPVFIAQPNKHWCLALIDFRRKEVVAYDPLQSQVYTRNLHTIISDTIIPTLPISKKLPTQLFYGYKQTDGDSCGVQICAFLENYLQVSEDDKELRRLRDGNVPSFSLEEIQRLRFDLLCRAWVEISRANSVE